LILAVKFIWIWKLKAPTGPLKWISGLSAAATVTSVLVILQFGSYQFASVRDIRGSAIVFVYGYPLTWLAQSFYVTDLKHIAAEIHRLRAITHEQLNLREAPWPVQDKIAVVQMESLERSRIQNQW
jgi:hypothetical protein